jgi:hypothetical protein
VDSGDTGRCRWSPVICSAWSACGERAAKRKNPPSSRARRPMPTSTASPLASQKFTLDRSTTSRLEPGRSKPRNCSRRAGALAMSSSPASSAMVMPPTVRMEISRLGLTVIPESLMVPRSGRGGTGCPMADMPGTPARREAAGSAVSPFRWRLASGSAWEHGKNFPEDLLAGNGLWKWLPTPETLSPFLEKNCGYWLGLVRWPAGSTIRSGAPDPGTCASANRRGCAAGVTGALCSPLRGA